MGTPSLSHDLRYSEFQRTGRPTAALGRCLSLQTGALMDRAMLVEQLVQAECDIVLGENHLARQRGVVAERWRQGLDVSEAIERLRQFEELQAMHVADRDRLRAKLGVRGSAPSGDLRSGMTRP
jgi:hypothetical protein